VLPWRGSLFHLAALALVADREQAEQATARALGEIWRFLNVG
jgi:hypothetical protein